MAQFRHQLVAPGRRMKPGCWKMYTISSVRYRVHVRSQGIKSAVQLLALFSVCRIALEFLQTHVY